MATTMLKGLFDRPIVPDVQQTAINALDSGYQVTNFGPGTMAADPLAVCDPGYEMDINGFCVPIPGFFDTGGGAAPPVDTSDTTVFSTTPVNVTVNTTNQITDSTISQLSDAVYNGIMQSAENVQNVLDSANKTIISEIQEDTDAITSGIAAASTNLGNEVTITTAAIAATTAASVATASNSVNGLISDAKNFLDPILNSILGVVDKINTEIQTINDSFLQPIVNLYNSTIGTISTLTTAIEQDLHNGLSGLLAIPGQLADQLGSFDAALQRTVEQLGTSNAATITTSIDYAGAQLPQPFSTAFAKSLGGTTLAGAIKTTFTGTVNLTNESLAQVSSEAISGLGTLLNEIIHIITSTFSATTNQLHADWSAVDSVFVSLLDGVLGLLTTVTAMGALAAPLVDIAEQQARSLVPTTKLDVASVIEAMRREILTTQEGLTELQTYGYDATRIQTLQDLSIYLADVNTALDWWYRGIISDDDFAANMNAHGIEPGDQTAIKAGSTYLPSIGELVRWMNFGIISQDEFVSNARVLRYDDAQIQATLGTYQDHVSPQLAAQLTGLVNNSSIGWINSTFSLPVPEPVATAAQRANLHPDYAQYIWLSHWNLPSTQAFIMLYFRGIRTLTELQARMGMDNIPQELWDDMIQVNRSLIPYRSIPSFVKAGYMTIDQAQKELAAHGFDLAHQQIIMAAIKPPVDTTNAAAATAIHTLSQTNARELWGEGAITDAQYTQVLEAHGYTADTAALQLKADAISEHIKAQKQTLSDLTAEVLAGATTGDAATAQLNQQGFTQAQISKFQIAIAKSQKQNVKIPSIPELTKFLKAALITLDQYKQALVDLGWQDPWLTAYVALVSAPDTSGSTGGTT